VLVVGRGRRSKTIAAAANLSATQRKSGGGRRKQPRREFGVGHC